MTGRRAEAAGILAEVAEDAPTRQALAGLGRAYLPDVAGPARPEAVEPSLAAFALAESLRADPSRVDGVIARLAKEENPTIRQALLLALGELEAEPQAGRIRDLTLDPSLRNNEVFGPLGNQLSKRQTREVAWAWFVAHYAPMVARLADEDRAFLPGLALGFCSEADAQRVEAFFTPHLPELPGADRPLKQALETIRLCAAQVAAQRESARAYFTSH